MAAGNRGRNLQTGTVRCRSLYREVSFWVVHFVLRNMCWFAASQANQRLSLMAPLAGKSGIHQWVTE
jgi:hypothetical protein